MFGPVKGPLWAQAYQKNMKAYADLGPDIFSGLHANFGPQSFLAQLEWANECWHVGLLRSFQPNTLLR